MEKPPWHSQKKMRTYPRIWAAWFRPLHCGEAAHASFPPGPGGPLWDSNEMEKSFSIEAAGVDNQAVPHGPSAARATMRKQRENEDPFSSRGNPRRCVRLTRDGEAILRRIVQNEPQEIWCGRARPDVFLLERLLEEALYAVEDYSASSGRRPGIFSGALQLAKVRLIAEPGPSQRSVRVEELRKVDEQLKKLPAASGF